MSCRARQTRWLPGSSVASVCSLRGLVCMCVALTVVLAHGRVAGADEREPALAPVSAARVSLSATPSAARVGDPVALSLRVESTELLQIHWPDVAAQFDPTAAIASPGAAANALPGMAGTASPGAAASHASTALRATADGWAYLRHYTIQPTRAGPLRIPALAVRCTPVSATGHAQAFALIAPELTIPVASVLSAGDDPLRPRDMAGPLRPPAAAPRWPWLAGLAAAALSVATLVALWWRGRPALPDDPAAAALAELERLAREATDDQAAFDAYAFHHRLAGCVRAFVERRFAIPAPEMTTPELLRAVARHNGELARLDADRLRALLQACDRVKYAAFAAGRGDAAAAVAAARALVERARGAPYTGEGGSGPDPRQSVTLPLPPPWKGGELGSGRRGGESGSGRRPRRSGSGTNVETPSRRRGT